MPKILPPVRRKAMISFLVLAAFSAPWSTPADAEAPPLPAGYWDAEQSGAILDKTLTVHLEPDLGDLSPAARRTIDLLLQVGDLFHRLYERQQHPQAEKALADLQALDERLGSPPATRHLLTLYRLSEGPIATTLENEREAFLPVVPEVAGKNVYPPDASRQAIDAYAAAHPAQRDSLFNPRSVLRRATAANLRADLQTLATRPVLGVLHPGLEANLRARLGEDDQGFYAVPYSLAYAEEIFAAYDLLIDAATTIADEDADLAAYLRLRARDLLADDYEGGDAAWVRGSFGDLNVQVGSYETYDDGLYGVRTFFSLSLLRRDRERSARLEAAIGSIQEIEDSLPYEGHKRVRNDIPVGVYQVIADFGQARGANTATILPNDAAHARKYGRTILMRHNILTHPALFALAEARFEAALDPVHHGDMTLESGFQRTLWHEIGHYLGVDQTTAGGDLAVALAPYADHLEEMKSDLVSLFAARGLAASGYHSPAELRAVYASGVLRVLQDVKPRRSEPYRTMQLMQWNYFLEHGLLHYKRASGRMGIDYDVYHQVVGAMLKEVLAVQAAGDAERAAAFVERWGSWRDDLHEKVAARLRAAVPYRYLLVRYGVLDGPEGTPTLP